MSRKAYSKKNKLAATTFYEVLEEEADRNDKTVMVSALRMILEVIKGFRTEFDYASGEIESQNSSKKTNSLEQLKSLVVSFGKFYDNWFSPFLIAFKGDLSCFANYTDDEIDKMRSDEVDNIWLPSLRSTLHKVKVDIPRFLYDLSEDYAYLSFGMKFFSDDFCREGRLWTANPYGTGEDVGYVHKKLWTEDPVQGDRNLLKKFLTSTAAFASLQAYKRKNVLFHCMPGAELTKDNVNRLGNMSIWLEKWKEERSEILEMLNESDENGSKTRTRTHTVVKFKLPKKYRYEEATYKLNPSTYYMKCPGCEFIVVFPDKPQFMSFMSCIKRKDGSGGSVWELARNDSHKLDLPNVLFESTLKRKHSYKVMQQHIAKCEGCATAVLPDCFGRRGRLHKDSNKPKNQPFENERTNLIQQDTNEVTQAEAV